MVWTDASGKNDGIVEYIRHVTGLKDDRVQHSWFYAPHNRKYRSNPQWLRRLTALDAPTCMVTYVGIDGHQLPVCALLIERHTPMGQNAFQSFPKIIGPVLTGFPVVWVHPESGMVIRSDGSSSVETPPPLLPHALLTVWEVHNIPVLQVPWPQQPDSALQLDSDPVWPSLPNATSAIDFTILLRGFFGSAPTMDERAAVANSVTVQQLRRRMNDHRYSKGEQVLSRPLSKNSGVIVPRSELVAFWTMHGLVGQARNALVHSLSNFNTCCVVLTASKEIRADPYAGTAAVYDYAFCRVGPRTTDRSASLVFFFRSVTLDEGWQRLIGGSTTRESRLFLHFADAVAFRDGCMIKTPEGWRGVDNNECEGGI